MEVGKAILPPGRLNSKGRGVLIAMQLALSVILLGVTQFSAHAREGCHAERCSAESGARELRKGGGCIRLQEQPFQILVEHSGEAVTRDEIRKKLWPNNTAVEFDHSIHSSINKLRQALEDSTDKPTYIETVGRRGYRLIAPVECLESSSDDEDGPTPTLSPKAGERDRARIIKGRPFRIKLWLLCCSSNQRLTKGTP
jgi:DNA-binding winged helix-turn-helix (wHTH) protein